MPNAPAPINHGAIMPVSGWAPTRPVRFSLGDRQQTATNCHFISPSFFFSWSEGFNRESLCARPDISYLIKAILFHGNGRKSKTLKRQKDQQLCFNGPKVAFVLHAVHTRKSTLNVFISAEYFSYFLKQVVVRGRKKKYFPLWCRPTFSRFMSARRREKHVSHRGCVQFLKKEISMSVDLLYYNLESI